ncbi:MAG: putative rane protein [Firmicutes bacterium]|nr:putative rane protein [Bacillota bacterium]
MVNFSKALITRIVLFLIALFFMGLGIGLITRANLGTSPISSVPYILSLIIPLTFGELTFLFSIFCLLVEIIILKKEFPKEQYLQVLVGPFFGCFTDFGMYVFSFLRLNSYIDQVFALIVGCAILALGVYLQVVANVIINPGEGVVKVIANKIGKEFGNVKVMFDFSLVIIGVIISLCAFGTIKGLREGTIISAILVGPITKIYKSIFEFCSYKQKTEKFL